MAADLTSCTGSVYVYATSDGSLSWSEQQVLAASDGAAGDDFGYAIALYNDMIVVGVHFDDNIKGNNAGASNMFLNF